MQYKDSGEKTLTRKIIEAFPTFMHKMLKGFDFAAAGLTLNKTQQKTLHIIYYHKTTYMGDICSHLNMRKGSFTPVVESLIKKNLISRKRDQKDRRKIYLTLTEKGLEYTVMVEHKLNEHLVRRVEALSGIDQEKLLRAIDDINEIAAKL